MKAIDALYRPGSFIGDGGTASVLKFEKKTGEHVSRNPEGHYIKAQEMTRFIPITGFGPYLSASTPDRSDRKTAGIIGAEKTLENITGLIE